MTALDPALAGAVRDLMAMRFGLMPQTYTDDELAQRLRPELGSDAAIGETLRRAAGQPLAGADLQRLVAALTIRESSFLRQRSWFEALVRDFIVPLIDRKRAAGVRRLCLWSAGCASGEEAYSLALVVRECLPDAAAWIIEVRGTDVCAAALAQARSGRYRDWSLREVSAERRAAHFAFEDGEARVSDILRGMAEFRLGNLLDGSDEGPERPDVVLCRHVLMHLDPAARARVAGRLVARLAEGGVLATAPSEASLELFRPLVRHDHGELLVFRAPPPAPQGARRPTVVAAPSPTAPPEPRPPHPVPAARSAQAAAARDAAGNDVAAPSGAGPGLEAGIDRLVAAGRFAEAARLCEGAIEAARLDPAPLRLLAAVQEAGGDVAAACRTLRRVLYLDEQDCDARFRLAGLLRRLGRGIEARRELQGIVDLADRATHPASATAQPDPARARIVRAARQMLDSGGSPRRAGRCP